MIQFDEHIFQMGWNHQLDAYSPDFHQMASLTSPLKLNSAAFEKDSIGRVLSFFGGW